MFKSLLEYEIVEQKILLRPGKRHSHVKWNEYLFKSFFVASHTPTEIVITLLKHLHLIKAD